MRADEAALLSWAIEPLPTLALLCTALIYLRGWWRLRAQVPGRYPPWRAWCFLGGLLTLFVSISSPLDAFASFLLASHMIQHLLLTMVAPPLLLLGAPQLPLLRGLPKSWVREGIAPFFRSPSLRAVFHFVTHPVVCWVLFVLSNVLWHVPDFYEAALRSAFWHEVEHACFLGTSLLFWWHVVLPWPARARWPRIAIIPYLVLADLQNTALAAILSFSDRVLYPTYSEAPRVFDWTALQDQAAAGALMWVPGSIAFLVPAGAIAFQYLAPRNTVRPSDFRKGADKQPAMAGVSRIGKARPASAVFDPRFFVPWRRVLQIIMLCLALAIVADGLLGPELSPMNLAGVLPWTHWRTFTVIALLVAGNFFCMACPFTFVRDLGRRIFHFQRPWPRVLRSKWLAVGLIVAYLWAYEAFDLWDRPAVTAWIILGYFGAAMLIDGIFRGASFCKFVCPIGQFHFVQSLVSPLEIKPKDAAVCASCKTFECIKGSAVQRGCELELFVPRKSGNMDCTLCLDCVKACPHGNVGLAPVVPGSDLLNAGPRSSIGKYGHRVDLAALVLVLTFGAFANAAGMVAPVLDGLDATISALGPWSSFPLLALLAVATLIVLPGTAAFAAAWRSAAVARRSVKEVFCRFSLALVPLGFGMWLAHFVFHFFTAALTPIPVLQRVAGDLGLTAADPKWDIGSWAFQDLPALELLLLDAGLLLTLYLLWKIAGQLAAMRRLSAFLPWAVVAVLLYAAGVWIIFQPMEMRGTLMH